MTTEMFLDTNNRPYGDIRLGVFICDCSNVQPENGGYTALQSILAYAEVLSLAHKSREFTLKNSGMRSRDVNVRYVDQVVAILNNNNVHSPSRVFRPEGGYPRDSLDHLITVGENLSPYNSENIISETQIKDIVIELDDLIDKIMRSEFEDEAKGRMTDILSRLRSLILRVNVIGSDEFFSKLDEFSGQALKEVLKGAGGKNEKQGALAILKKTVEFTEAVQKIVDIGQKAYPILEAGMRALGW